VPDWYEPDVSPFHGSVWNAMNDPKWNPPERKRVAREAPKTRFNMKRDAAGNPQDLLKILSQWDVKRNPNMLTRAGLERWKEKRKGRLIDWRDVNGDEIPDALAGWDADTNGQLTDDEISHVNGYYVKPTDWAYRQRYAADREAHPELFENGKMPMGRYIRRLYDADVRPHTGEVLWNENDPVRVPWEKMIKSHGYKIKKPSHQITPLTLWRMWVFRPVYDDFVNGKTLVDDNGNEYPLSKDPDFSLLVASNRCYKIRFTDYIIDQYNKAHALTPNQRKSITKQKEFRERLKRYVMSRLSHLSYGWREVYNFLAAAAIDIIGFKQEQLNAYDETSIGRRYMALLKEFEKNETADLTYTDLSIPYDDPGRWIPTGTPETYLTKWHADHPDRHQAWTDGYGNVYTDAHAGDPGLEQLRSQANVTQDEWNRMFGSKRGSSASASASQSPYSSQSGAGTQPSGRPAPLRRVGHVPPVGGP
jgi:hypothetical protein